MVSNYRPVSLPNQNCKLLESIVRDALVNHLEKNKLLAESQHGFRRGRSCLTNVLVFLDKVTRSIDEGIPIDSIYLDFAKAFDKVPHIRLLKKVESHGITGNVLRWIKNWLKERRQRVCIEGIESSWRQVESGVPQGSVLGPVLFLIYINDLDSRILNLILKFADDTKLYGSVANDKERANLQKDLETLEKWSLDWQLPFNVDKCKVVHYGKNNQDFKYFIDKRELKKEVEEVDLGILTTNDLKTSKQCRQAYNKASRMLGMIRRSITFKHKDIILSLYKSIVRPLVEYAVPAWSPHYLKDKELLERVQHRITRMIPGMKNKSYENRLVELNLWSLEERRNRADIIEVFKIYKGFSAIRFEDLFTKCNTVRTRGHTAKVLKKRCKTDLRKFFFSERVIDRWNSLDQKCIEAESINAFKNNLSRLRNTRMGFFYD
jgi:hypothetical protein